MCEIDVSQIMYAIKYFQVQFALNFNVKWLFYHLKIKFPFVSFYCLAYRNKQKKISN